jgi:hypothetical protein
MFHLFQMYVASVLSRCCRSRSRCCMYMHVASICFKCSRYFHTHVCKCFIWMLHMFAIIFKCFLGVFHKCFRRLFLSVSFAFTCMLQVLHLHVSKVDWMFHLPLRFLLSCLDVSSSFRRWLSICRPLSLFLDAGDSRGGVGLTWTRETTWKWLHAWASESI